MPTPQIFAQLLKLDKLGFSCYYVARFGGFVGKIQIGTARAGREMSMGRDENRVFPTRELALSCAIACATHEITWKARRDARRDAERNPAAAATKAFRMNTRITRKGYMAEIKAICLAAAAAGCVGLNDAPRLKQRATYLRGQIAIAARHPFNFAPFTATPQPAGYVMPSGEWIKVKR